MARKPRQLLMSQKWAENNFEKMMQRSDHCDGLVVLVPKTVARDEWDAVSDERGGHQTMCQGGVL